MKPLDPGRRVSSNSTRDVDCLIDPGVHRPRLMDREPRLICTQQKNIMENQGHSRSTNDLELMSEEQLSNIQHYRLSITQLACLLWKCWFKRVVFHRDLQLRPFDLEIRVIHSCHKMHQCCKLGENPLSIFKDSVLTVFTHEQPGTGLKH